MHDCCHAGERPYLLDVPIVKFMVYQLLDFLLTIMLTFSWLPVAMSHGALGPQSILLIELLWVVASLLSEIRQIATEDSGGLWHELQALFSSESHSAYRSDMFNHLDMAALITATAALVTQLVEGPHDAIAAHAIADAPSIHDGHAHTHRLLARAGLLPIPLAPCLT